MIDISALPRVSQTLFIPLAVRAAESAEKEPLFIDEKAAEILRACDTRGIVTDGGAMASHGIRSRTVTLDARVDELLRASPDAVVINLGAGLDTRFFRLDNGRARWIDIDLPEVIDLRRRFISENERLRFLPATVLDDGWTRGLMRDPDAPVILLAEGLLMYFPEERVKSILAYFARAFPGADMLFDVVHASFVGKKISSDFLWGIDRAEEIEALAPGARLVQAWRTGDLLPDKQPFALRLLNVFPATRARSQILHIKLKG